MRKILFPLVAIPFLAFAQKAPVVKFGAVTMEELKMDVYDLDSAASAVILFDVGNSPSNDPFTRHTRIKILKEDGYSWANVAVPMFSSSFMAKEAMKSLKASTYNLVDGKIVETKLETDGKFKEEFVKGINVVRFALPRVKVGSVIEYQYEVNSGFRNWEFQHLIPCKWSEYRISITDAVVFHTQFIGYLTPVINEEGFEYCTSAASHNCQVRRWAMTNVPAFKDEPFISSYTNYTSQVKFSISSYQPANGPAVLFMTNWDALKNRYFSQEFFGDNVKGSGFLKKTAKDLVEGLVLPDEKLRVIYEFVKGKLEWSGRNTILMTNDQKQIMEESKGSSGDINLILLAMLRYADLPADPVLISTTDNGFVRQEMPTTSQFNRVLVWSDYKGKKTLLDATDKFLSMEYIPQSCLNGTGYAALENSFQWVSLTEMPRTKLVSNLDMQIESDGEMIGKISFSKTGFEARNSREKIGKNGKKEYLNETFKGKTINVKDTVIENIEKINEPLKESYTVSLTEHAQATGDVIYIDPMIFAKAEANPFVAEMRTYPVDFGFPRETIYSLKLKIPDGFVVDELPQSKLSVLPENGGKFLYSISQANGTINIIYQMIINRVIFSQIEYPALREFYNIMAAKHREQIVLKKK